MKTKTILIRIIATLSTLFGVFFIFAGLIRDSAGSNYNLAQDMSGIFLMGAVPLIQGIAAFIFTAKYAQHFFKVLLGNVILFLSSFVQLDALIEYFTNQQREGLNGMEFSKNSFMSTQSIISGFFMLMGIFLILICIKKINITQNPLEQYTAQQDGKKDYKVL